MWGGGNFWVGVVGGVGKMMGELSGDGELVVCVVGGESVGWWGGVKGGEVGMVWEGCGEKMGRR